jgi:hypothetical protein
MISHSLDSSKNFFPASKVQVTLMVLVCFLYFLYIGSSCDGCEDYSNLKLPDDSDIKTCDDCKGSCTRYSIMRIEKKSGNNVINIQVESSLRR